MISSQACNALNDEVVNTYWFEIKIKNLRFTLIINRFHITNSRMDTFVMNLTERDMWCIKKYLNHCMCSVISFDILLTNRLMKTYWIKRIKQGSFFVISRFSMIWGDLRNVFPDFSPLFLPFHKNQFPSSWGRWR